MNGLLYGVDIVVDGVGSSLCEGADLALTLKHSLAPYWTIKFHDHHRILCEQDRSHESIENCGVQLTCTGPSPSLPSSRPSLFEIQIFHFVGTFHRQTFDIPGCSKGSKLA